MIKAKWLQELHNNTNKCLIMGDFNAAFQIKGSRRINRVGKHLLTILEDGYLSCIDDNSTTFERGENEEKLDWILASEPLISLVSNVEIHSRLWINTGHNPLTFEVKLEADIIPPSPRAIFDYKKANWAHYRITLDRLLRTSEKEVEELTSHITSCIVEAANTAIPKAGRNIQSWRINVATKSLVKEKHSLYRKWKVNKSKKRTKTNFSHEINYKGQVAKTEEGKTDLFASYYEKKVFEKSPDTNRFHLSINKRIQQKTESRPILVKIN